MTVKTRPGAIENAVFSRPRPLYAREAPMRNRHLFRRAAAKEDAKQPFEPLGRVEEIAVGGGLHIMAT
jgi:hypothetical protein